MDKKDLRLQSILEVLIGKENASKPKWKRLGLYEQSGLIIAEILRLKHTITHKDECLLILQGKIKVLQRQEQLSFSPRPYPNGQSSKKREMADE